METAAPSQHPQARLPIAFTLPLTKRQLAILQDLDEHRFMHTGQFQRLYGPRAKRDLKHLTEQGMIDQPKAQWVWRRREGGGSRPRIHSLANAGAALLRELKLSHRKRDWAELNRDLSPAWFILNVPHELAVVDACLAFRRGVADRPDHWLMTAGMKGLSIPGRDRSLFPDKPLIAGRDGGTPVVLPLEVDRSTEPNMRRPGAELAHLGEKLAAYHVYAHAGQHLADFGTPRLRVLTVISGGEAKMRNVARTAFEICGGIAVDRFLVTSLSALLEGDPFAIPWLNAAEEPVRLEV